MVGSLRARLLGSMVAATAIAVGAIVLLGEPLLEDRAQRDVEQELDGMAEEITSTVETDIDAHALAEIRRVRVAHVDIFDPDHASVGELSGAPSHLTEEDFGQLHSRGRLVDTRTDNSGQRWVLVALRNDSGVVVSVQRPMPPITSARRTMRQLLLLAMLFALLMTVFLSEYFARAIGRRIRTMSDTADAVRSGDYHRRVRPTDPDELGALGRALDQMADQLVDQLDAVRTEEGRLRTVLDAMVEAVFVTDAKGRIVLTNSALSQLTKRDVRGHTAVEAIRSAELHEAVRHATNGTPGEVQFSLTSGGDRLSIAAHVAPLPNRAGVVVVLHDVTELKRTDAIRRDFVANASHELRTPLTAIRGFAETLRDGALSDPRAARRFVTNIADNAVRLHQLVDDLIDLSRAESPDSTFDVEHVDLVEVAAEVLKALESKASKKGQQLGMDGVNDSAVAMTDRHAVDQVLINLIDNAIKYTPEGGRVRISIDSAAHSQDGEIGVALSVSDTGRGIPRQHLDRIFERFYRVDKGRSRKEGGTGLGLSIVRHLVSRLRGEISVESTVGAGSTFRVWLPEKAAALPEDDERGDLELASE